MSGKLLGALLESSLKGSQQLVMLALVNHAYDDGSGARPGLERICWETGLCRRRVISVLQDLEQLGVVEAVAYPNGGRGKTTEFQLYLHVAPRKTPLRPPETVQSGVHPLTAETVQSGVHPLPSENGAISDENGAISAQNGATAQFKSAHQSPVQTVQTSELASARARARASEQASQRGLFFWEDGDARPPASQPPDADPPKASEPACGLRGDLAAGSPRSESSTDRCAKDADADAPAAGPVAVDLDADAEAQIQTETAHQVALPGTAAVGLPAWDVTPWPHAHPGPEVPLRLECQACHRPIGRFTGRGHASDCAAYGWTVASEVAV
jgi:hypothetical protein